MLYLIWKFSSIWLLVELNGANIILLVEAFLIREFYVEFNILSVNGSVFTTSF